MENSEIIKIIEALVKSVQNNSVVYAADWTTIRKAEEAIKSLS